MVTLYLIFGLIFYCIMSILNIRSFNKATPISILKGLLFGIIFWPLAWLYVTYQVISYLRRS